MNAPCHCHSKFEKKKLPSSLKEFPVNLMYISGD